MNLHERPTQTQERALQASMTKRAGELSKLAHDEGGYADFRNTMNLPHREALQQSTEFIAENHNEFNLNQADASFIDLIGRTGGFIESQAELNVTYDYAEKRRLKDEHIIPFNDSLKNYINHHASDSYSALSQTLSAAYVGLFQQKSQTENLITNGDIQQSFTDIINGIRHEIAAETLLDSVGVDIYYEDLDDRRGEDLKVKLDAKLLDEIYGGPDWHRDIDDEIYRNLVDTWLSVDIKSSSAAEGRGQANYPDNIIVWTGLNDSDFKGPKGNTPGVLTIPFQGSEEKGYAFLTRLIENAIPAIDAQLRR